MVLVLGLVRVLSGLYLVIYFVEASKGTHPFLRDPP